MDVNNQPSDISKLPDEVLMKIFAFLHGNNLHKANSDLINATLVCKKWNRIITESPRLMDKIMLKLDLISECAIDEIIEESMLKITRPYRHAILFDKIHDKYDNFRKKIRIAGKIEKVLNFEPLKNLTTVEFNALKVTPTLIKTLSLCKLLKGMILNQCWHDGEFERYEKIEQFGFCNLRAFKLNEEFDEHHLSKILPHIKCKHLHTFVIDIQPDDPSILNSIATDIFGFLNQLDHCNEIDLLITDWSFEQIRFEPKFQWSKLKLTFDGAWMRPSAAKTVEVLEVLCKASRPDAESEIIFVGFDAENEQICTAVLNSCKKITSLSLEYSMISVANHLRRLDELQTLKIDETSFNSDELVHFTKKLPNVVHLVITEIDVIAINTESALLLQPFFNQITSISLPSEYLRQMVNAVEIDGFVSLMDIEFKSLKTITANGNYESRDEDLIRFFGPSEFPGAPFYQFFALNSKVKHLNIEITFDKPPILIGWFTKFKATTAIQSCKISISLLDPPKFIHWREGEFDEVQLFGKVLNDEENQFFV